MGCLGRQRQRRRPGEEGATLATADDASANLALQIAQANLTAAQAKLASDQGTPTSEQKTAAKNSLTQAQQQLSDAQQSLKDTQAQNALTLSNARAAVTTANSQLATDTANSAASAVITADKNAVKSAKQQLASTRLQVASSNHKAQQAVTSARLSLANAKNSYTTSVQPATDATIASDQAQVATAQQAVTTAQQTLDGATIVAPTDGTIVAVNLQQGVAAPSGDAIQVQSSAMSVTAAFAETDMPALKVGQAASVSVTAIGQTVTGKVIEITPVAASSGTSSVVTYSVTVALNNTPTQLRSGMSANVSVTTASATGVIAVPAIALVGSAGNYSVRVLDGSGQVSVVPVTVGLTTSSVAEIRSGLSEGETIVTGTSTPRQGTTTGGGGGFGGLGGFPGGGGVRIPAGGGIGR